MGRSQICFGISFSPEYKFPWDRDRYVGINDWWEEIRGYKEPFKLWENGKINEEYKDRSCCHEYYEHKRAWQKSNPVPVEVVKHCSSDYPMVIIAVPGTWIQALSGYPKCFKPSDLHVDIYTECQVIDFCKKYCNPKSYCFPKMELKWWLTSYWY